MAKLFAVIRFSDEYSKIRVKNRIKYLQEKNQSIDQERKKVLGRMTEDSHSEWGVNDQVILSHVDNEEMDHYNEMKMEREREKEKMLRLDRWDLIPLMK